LSDESETIPEVAYNSSIGLLTQRKEFNYSTFKGELEQSDKEVDDFVNAFIHRVSNCDLIENYWTDTSKFRVISRLLMKTVASHFWTKTLGFDPLVDSYYLDIKRGEKENKASYKKRKLQHMRIPIKRNDALLREHICDMLVHKHKKAHANALVYILEVICNRDNLNWFASRYISSNENLSPTVEQLRRLGRIPDIKIREYRNLFHIREWVEIQHSVLYETEVRMKELVKQKLIPTNVKQFYDSLIELEKRTKTDPFSATILEVKRLRLGKAAFWKRKGADDQSVQVMNLARRKIREENNMEVFSPQKVLVASGKYGALSEIATCITYVARTNTWEATPMYRELHDAVKVVVDEFLLWLNNA
jgi:hypothetical protein